MTRMVVADNVEHGWQIKHFKIHRAFLHEKYGYQKPVYIREMAWENEEHKHGNTVVILVKKHYGDPSGTYYYIEGFLSYKRDTGQEIMNMNYVWCVQF